MRTTASNTCRPGRSVITGTPGRQPPVHQGRAADSSCLGSVHDMARGKLFKTYEKGLSALTMTTLTVPPGTAPT